MVSTAKLRPEKGPLRQSLYLKVKLQFFRTVERPIKKSNVILLLGGGRKGETRVFILGAELMNPVLFWP